MWINSITFQVGPELDSQPTTRFQCRWFTWNQLGKKQTTGWVRMLEIDSIRLPYSIRRNGKMVNCNSIGCSTMEIWIRTTEAEEELKGKLPFIHDPQSEPNPRSHSVESVRNCSVPPFTPSPFNHPMSTVTIVYPRPALLPPHPPLPTFRSWWLQ